MRRLNRGLVAAMEEEEVVVPPTDDKKPGEGEGAGAEGTGAGEGSEGAGAEGAGEPDPLEGLDNAESVETDMIDIAEDVAEQDTAADDLEETEEVAEALESIADALAVSAANGGMDKYSAQAVGIATQYLYDRVGIRAKAMPALESFGGTSSRIGATQLAMEEIKEQIKKIWEAIVNAIKKSIQWIKDFYVKVTQSFDKLEARAKSIAEKAGKVTGEQKTTELTKEGIFKALRFENKVELESIELVSVAAISLSAKQNVLSAVNDAINVVKASEGDSGKYIASLKLPGVSSMGTMKEITDYDKYHIAKPAEGSGFYSIYDGLLPGNFFVGLYWPKEELVGEKAAEAYKNKHALGTANGYVDQDMPSDVKFKALTSKEVQTLAGHVADWAQKSGEFKKYLPEIEKLQKEMVSLGDKLKGKPEDDKVAKSVVSSASKLITGGSSALSVYSLRSLKACLDYCEESLKTYAEPKAEEKKPEEKK